MQWTEEKGRGFSTKSRAYLPTSKKKGQSVEAQEKDENSILNTVRELIKIRKEYPALNANGSQAFVEKGYPAIFERVNGEQKITVIVNPSDKTIQRKLKFSKVIKSQNVTVNGEEILLGAQSYAILLT